MEYQFTHTMHGVVAKCSMDHEAFSRWLNTEIAVEPKLLHDIFTEIAKCRCHFNYEAIFEGHEYSLYLSAEEVMVKANYLEMEIDDFELMEEGLNFYDEESIAFCGLDDFEMFLQAYQKFITLYH
ncbi:MAG: YacL family protein [Pasteurellaceae bacterium]|nr:YacL family protein [Pasteurellaceae bacterium]